jgi:hypothetical protein
MTKDITFREFEGINSFSSGNIESMLRAYINESANAALVSTFDDGVILFDVNEEKFYSANYSLNRENLQVVLENFDAINLKEDEKVNFKMAAKRYFIEEDVDVSSLARDYAEFMEKPKAAVEKLIAEAVSDKDFSNSADFEELSYINEGFAELRNEDFFKDYQKRLVSNPLSDVLYFNWKDPVAFSLYESTEPEKYINSKGKEKAKGLAKNKKFKKDVVKACGVFKEDVEEGGELLFKLFEEYPSLFFLNESEIKEMFGRTLLIDPTTQKDYKSILEGVKTFMITDPEMAELKYSILGEAIDIGSGAEDDDLEPGAEADKKDSDDKKDDDDEEKKDDKKEEKAKELSAEEKEKLVSALKTVVDKAVDEKIKEMAQELLDKFDTEDEGTKPEDVKEAVRFLSICL